MENKLTLTQIAAWQLGHLVPDDEPCWVATLPSLQRDAVWKSGQVELLWDSLFRGFPIGSLVVSEELKDQKSRYGKLAGDKDPWPGKEKRHLLDGQQRSNAIALGFFLTLLLCVLSISEAFCGWIYVPIRRPLKLGRDTLFSASRQARIPEAMKPVMLRADCMHLKYKRPFTHVAGNQRRGIPINGQK